MTRCVYCGGHAKSKDHLVPLAKGGGPSENIVPACLPCNGMKADMDPRDFFRAYPECAREFAARAPYHIPAEIVAFARSVWEEQQGHNLVVGAPLRDRLRKRRRTACYDEIVVAGEGGDLTNRVRVSSASASGYGPEEAATGLPRPAATRGTA